MKTTHETPDHTGEEIEFKLGIRRSGAARAAAAVLELDSASRLELHALYFDTPDAALGAAGISLRLRERNGTWVQTVKMKQADGNRRRFEHEVSVPTDAEAIPALDLARHRGTVAGDCAIALLEGPDVGDSTLAVRYATEVQRTAGLLRHGSSTIEVACDRGHVEAMGRRLVVNEIELELKDGNASDLLDAAGDWMRVHGAWLLHESKADRGQRLARGQTQPPVVKARELYVAHAGELGALSRAVFENCLVQILPNAAAVAEGSEDADHVHQLRVGIRRLRTALEELGPEPGLVESVGPPLAAVFRALGQHRDQEHVHESVERRVLAETDATDAAWASSGEKRRIDLRALVRDPAFQAALLGVLRLAEASQDRRVLPDRRSKRWLRPRLDCLSRRVARGGKRFNRLPTEAQHKVRKRLKRLRYLSEFAAPLFSAKRVKRYLRTLEPAQDALGKHNDLAVARDMAAVSQRTDRNARIAVGWIDEEQERTARQAMKALRIARKADGFW